MSILSTSKYGSGTTEAYIQLIENIDFRVPTSGSYYFKCAANTALFADKGGAVVNALVSEPRGSWFET